MKLNITWVGQQKTIDTKYGPKQKSSLRATQYGEKYLDYWVGNTNIKVGDEIEVEAVNPREYNGKTYYDVVFPKVQKMGGVDKTEILALSHKIDQVQSQLRSVIDHLSGKNRLDLTSAGTKIPDFSEVDDINPDNIPF